MTICPWSISLEVVNVAKRKTYTSPEVKDRWNRKHYDRMAVIIPKGSRDEINAAAQRRGMSTSAYVRSLLLRDMCENGDNATNLAGGGVAERWERSELERKRHSALMQLMEAIEDGQDPGQLSMF